MNPRPKPTRPAVFGLALVLAALALGAPRLNELRAQPVGDPAVYLPLGLDGAAEEAAPAQASPSSPAPTVTPIPSVSSVPPPPATATPIATPTAGVPPPLPAPVVVIPRGIQPEEWAGDAFDVLEAKVSGDFLELTVQYGGGCHPHDFWLVGSAWFMESEPPQVDLLLSHDGHNDLCGALVTTHLVFDLRPLARK